MALIDPLGYYSIADFAKATGPDGTLYPIYDGLRRRDPIMVDAVWTRANRPEFHRMNISDTLITGSLVGLNEGVAGTNKPIRTVDEHMARIETNSFVDVRMKDYYQEAFNQYRSTQDTAKVKDLGYQLSGMVINGSRGTDGKGFDGLKTRLAALNTSGSYPLVWGAGSTANLSSIYLVNWDQDGTFMIYPNGADGPDLGFTVKNMGEHPVNDAGGNPFFAAITWMTMRGGLAIKEPKSVARIANIDTTSSASFTTAITQLNRAIAWMRTSGKIYAYVSPLVYAMLQDYAQTKTNIFYKLDEFGKPYMDFMGVSWRISENITNTETQVV